MKRSVKLDSISRMLMTVGLFEMPAVSEYT